MASFMFVLVGLMFLTLVWYRVYMQYFHNWTGNRFAHNPIKAHHSFMKCVSCVSCFLIQNCVFPLVLFVQYESHHLDFVLISVMLVLALDLTIMFLYLSL